MCAMRAANGRAKNRKERLVSARFLQSFRSIPICLIKAITDHQQEQPRLRAASIIQYRDNDMKFTDLVPKGIIAGTSGEDAISLLTADHEKVQDLFRQFAALKDASDARAQQEKQRIVDAACKELTMHTMLEEEIFYPAVRAAIDDAETMNEAQVEHDGAKALIEQLGHMTAKNDMFNAKFTVLAEYVNHHIAEEQSSIFTQARIAGLDL